MIHGIGQDLVELERVEAILGGPHGEVFLERILTEAEREKSRLMIGARKKEYVAGRFAVKEAVAKALGCGIGASLGFQDICVLPSETGKPVCTISPEARSRLALPETCRIWVTITHTRTLASACAVVEV